MSRSWAKGSTRRWRGIRKRKLDDNLARNGGRCQLGIPGVCTGLADTVHHTKGRAVTGDDPRFLQAVCKACNLRIGMPKPSAAPQPRRVSRW